MKLTAQEDGSKPKVSRHKMVDRVVRVLPEVAVYEGRIWFDYTEIMRYAFETGQEMKIRRK